jgi:hypothetical protein
MDYQWVTLDHQGKDYGWSSIVSAGSERESEHQILVIPEFPRDWFIDVNQATLPHSGSTRL